MDTFNGVGDTIKYDIKVKNTGNVTLTLDNLVDVLTDGANNNLTLTTAPAFSSGTILGFG